MSPVVRTLQVQSRFQPGVRSVRLILPEAGREVSDVVYVLPVEPAGHCKFGDPAALIEAMNLPARHGAAFAVPDFAQSPWYADHPSRPDIRQESHFLHGVCPAVDRAIGGQSRRRMLLGFSKSGRGAWSLLLRHPQLFARALAWDAPLMQADVRFWEAPEIYGDQRNFDAYRPASLLEATHMGLGREPRLLMSGHVFYGRHHAQMHQLLERLDVPHLYQRRRYWRHSWREKWLQASTELLLA